MRSIHNSRVSRPTKYLRIRCVELARNGNKSILVGYNNKEMWFTLQFVKRIEHTEDGYTHLSVPDWMFKERIKRYNDQKREHFIKQEIDNNIRVRRRSRAVMDASKRFGYYDKGSNQ